MSSFGETDKSSKDEGEKNTGTGTVNNTTPNQSEEGKGNNTENIKGIQRHRRTELVQLHTAHRYFKGGTL